MAQKIHPNIKALAEIIKANPGCIAVIDNDEWSLYKKGYTQGDENYQEMMLADDSTHAGPDEGYGSGNCYGGDLLQALAHLAGIKIESV